MAAGKNQPTATDFAASTANAAASPNKAADPEAVLSGVVALAAMFSNTVEAFGLIHAGPKWEKGEQLLLSRLGVQQARLLIWGDIMGICSPPITITDRAIPKHPSAAYPDVKEPTFFGPRDPRLDARDTRVEIEKALGNIVDRSRGVSREQMMERYGMKPPKKYIHQYQQAIDVNRLEAFREKYELLKEVSETYARVNVRRSSSITTQQWMIAEQTRFAGFIKIIQDSVDSLINMMDVNERVDRAMRMDIRALGWHLTADNMRISQDISKLRLMQEVAWEEYPVYAAATQEALDNIEREKRENNPRLELAEKSGIQHHEAPDALPAPLSPGAQAPKSNGTGLHVPHHGGGSKEKRPSVFGGIFRSFRKEKPEQRARNASIADQGAHGVPPEPDAERSLSDSGLHRASAASDSSAGGDTDQLAQIRSKSLGDIQTPPHSSIDDALSAKLSQVKTSDTEQTVGTDDSEGVDPRAPLKHMDTMNSHISRHDQYHGIARTDTNDLWQGRYNESA